MNTGSVGRLFELCQRLRFLIFLIKLHSNPFCPLCTRVYQSELGSGKKRKFFFFFFMNKISNSFIYLVAYLMSPPNIKRLFYVLVLFCLFFSEKKSNKIKLKKLKPVQFQRFYFGIKNFQFLFIFFYFNFKLLT